jgi:ABC-type Fe3+/spermidine/putrescine transport system ATPase subunit
MGTEPLTLERLSISLGGARILDDVSLDVPAGGFTCLLGPSGCGKTTLLRAVAGFAPLASGDIRVGARSIAGLPPERRETAMVFQSYALWPHMNVGANLAYPLKLRRVNRAERDARVAAMLDLLELGGFQNRRVDSLSGGQRQRVALGRALIVDPPILLLDEPLSNLDAGIRRSLRGQLRRLQQKLGVTTIMVTHDQEEALAMADRVVLMRAGRIVQVADPQTLHDRPADMQAARFMGVDNLLPAAADDPGADAAAVHVGFRAANARIAAAPVPGALNRAGVVADCAYVGGGRQIVVDCAGAPVTALSAEPVAPGRTVFVTVPPSALMRFGADDALLPHTPTLH